ENEISDEDSKKHIDKVFEIAKEFDADIDMHVDVQCDPNSRSLEYYIAKTLKENYQGRVTASHVVALSYYNDYYARKIMRHLKLADMSITTEVPCTALIMSSLDREPKGRGITRVKELLYSGVNVAFGHDNIMDVFNPIGEIDALKIALLTVIIAQLGIPDEIEMTFDMGTSNAAKACGFEDYGIEVGKTANLNIIDAPTAQEAIRTQPDRLYVIREGRVIAENKTIRKIYRR
ncbi:MAG: amidohydrolase family protein, partial [Candidatus Bathyarchaeia archaeon]